MDTDEGRAARPLTPGALPAYRLEDAQLQMGPSLGNQRCWLNTKGTGDIECLYSVDIAQTVAGTIALRYAAVGESELLPDAAPETSHHPRSRLLLQQERAGTVTLHPAYWSHRWAAVEGLCGVAVEGGRLTVNPRLPPTGCGSACSGYPSPVTP